MKRRVCYTIARLMISEYPKIKNSKSKQEKMYVEAIENVLAKTAEMTNGDERIKAVKMVCFDKTHTIAGAAKVLNYSFSSVKYFLIDFTNAVWKEVGFGEDE